MSDNFNHFLVVVFLYSLDCLLKERVITTQLYVIKSLFKSIVHTNLQVIQHNS